MSVKTSYVPRGRRPWHTSDTEDVLHRAIADCSCTSELETLFTDFEPNLMTRDNHKYLFRELMYRGHPSKAMLWHHFAVRSFLFVRDNIAYSAINILAELKEIEFAKEVFNLAADDRHPPAYLYTAMLRAYGLTRRRDQAFQLSQNMKMDERLATMTPDDALDVYNTMIDVLVVTDELERTVEISKRYYTRFKSTLKKPTIQGLRAQQ